MPGSHQARRLFSATPKAFLLPIGKLAGVKKNVGQALLGSKLPSAASVLFFLTPASLPIQRSRLSGLH